MSYRNSPVIGDGGILIDEDERRHIVSTLVRETMTTYKLPRVASDEELEQRLSDYFNTCAITGEHPTVEQLAQCTGYSIKTVWDWENGFNKGFSAATSEIIKKAKSFLAVFDAKMVVAGKLNPVTYIFRAKNYYGLKDIQDVVITPNNLIGDIDNPDEIETITQRFIEGSVES